MSSNLAPTDLNDADCEKGQIAQRPHILYAPFKKSLAISTTRKSIKIKITEGDYKQTLLRDTVDREEIIKHLHSLSCLLGKKGIEDSPKMASETVGVAYTTVRKLRVVPKKP